VGKLFEVVVRAENCVHACAFCSAVSYRLQRRMALRELGSNNYILQTCQLEFANVGSRYTYRNVPTNFPRTGPNVGSSFGWLSMVFGGGGGGGLATILGLTCFGSWE